MRINGIGITFLGISKPDQHRTSTATEWFTFLYLPIVPLRRLRVEFLPHQGGGFSFLIISHEKFALSEILKTLLYCWLLIPLFAAAPFILMFEEIWTRLGLPVPVPLPYFLAAIVWAAIVIWKTADRHEARCRPRQE